MKTIPDQLLIHACEVYMQINGYDRHDLINEFKSLAEQVAPMRFDDLIQEIDSKNSFVDSHKQTILSFN